MSINLADVLAETESKMEVAALIAARNILNGTLSHNNAMWHAIEFMDLMMTDDLFDSFEELVAEKLYELEKVV